MNINRILPLLDNVNKQISQIKDLLTCPEGVRILSIHREDLSYIEYWDGDQFPRILFLIDKKAELKTMQQITTEALSLIPPSYCTTKKIELSTDLRLKDFTSEMSMAIKIFEIELSDIKQETIHLLKERYDFNSYMSRLKDFQTNNK